MTVALDFIQSVVALAFVLALAYGALWISRRYQRRTGPNDELRFIQAIPVGQRERVVLIAWRGETLLLGVTAGAVSLLARRPADASAHDLATAHEASHRRSAAATKR